MCEYRVALFGRGGAMVKDGSRRGRIASELHFVIRPAFDADG